MVTSPFVWLKHPSSRLLNWRVWLSKLLYERNIHMINSSCQSDRINWYLQNINWFLDHHKLSQQMAEKKVNCFASFWSSPKCWSRYKKHIQQVAHWQRIEFEWGEINRLNWSWLDWIAWGHMKRGMYSRVSGLFWHHRHRKSS